MVYSNQKARKLGLAFPLITREAIFKMTSNVIFLCVFSCLSLAQHSLFPAPQSKLLSTTFLRHSAVALAGPFIRWNGIYLLLCLCLSTARTFSGPVFSSPLRLRSRHGDRRTACAPQILQNWCTLTPPGPRSTAFFLSLPRVRLSQRVHEWYSHSNQP